MSDVLKIVSGLVFLVVAVWAGRRVWFAQIGQVRKISQSTLTLRQYLQKHPEAKTKTGIKCVACDSGSIKNWGLERADDSRRIFICNQCNTRLYRSDDW